MKRREFITLLGGAAARAAVYARAWGLVAATAFATGLSEVAAQEIITVCGASAGYGYYLEPKQDGWVKDGIKDDAGLLGPHHILHTIVGTPIQRLAAFEKAIKAGSRLPIYG
jgi:hypothetical protein